MGKKRKTHDGAFKAKIALEAVKGEKAIAQLVSEYGIHPNQIGQLKVELERLKKNLTYERVVGRVFDNRFAERLWRSVKYEEVYVHSYESVRDAWIDLTRYFQLYNRERLHESLGYRTPCLIFPDQLYFS